MLACAPRPCLHVHLLTEIGVHRRNLVQAQTNRQHSRAAPDAHKVGRLAAISVARVAHLRMDEVHNRRHVTFGVQTWHDGCPPISLPVPILMAR